MAAANVIYCRLQAIFDANFVESVCTQAESTGIITLVVSYLRSGPTHRTMCKKVIWEFESFHSKCRAFRPLSRYSFNALERARCRNVFNWKRLLLKVRSCAFSRSELHSLCTASPGEKRFKAGIKEALINTKKIIIDELKSKFISWMWCSEPTNELTRPQSSKARFIVINNSLSLPFSTKHKTKKNSTTMHELTRPSK